MESHPRNSCGIGILRIGICDAWRAVSRYVYEAFLACSSAFWLLWAWQLLYDAFREWQKRVHPVIRSLVDSCIWYFSCCSMADRGQMNATNLRKDRARRALSLGRPRNTRLPSFSLTIPTSPPAFRIYESFLIFSTATKHSWSDNCLVGCARLDFDAWSYVIVGGPRGHGTLQSH